MTEMLRDGDNKHLTQQYWPYICIPKVPQICQSIPQAHLFVVSAMILEYKYSCISHLVPLI